MRIALHLAAADLRRLWPGFVALLGLHALRVFVVEQSFMTSDDNPGQLTVLINAEALGLFVEVLATLIAVSVVVHRDPVVGRRAFWLTRPIPSRTLLLAKALVLSPLVIVPLALNAGRLIAYGGDAEAVIVSSLQFAVSRGAWMGVAWLIAAVTPSTLAFVLTGLGIWIAFVVYAMAAFAFSQWLTWGIEPLMVAVGVPPETSNAANWVTLTATVACCAAILAWQYQARRRAAAMAVVAVTMVALMNVRSLTPDVLLRPRDLPPPAWAEALDATRVTLADRRLTAEWRANTAYPRPTTYLAGRLTVSGIPAGYSATVAPRRTRLTAGDAMVEGGGQPRSPDPPQRRLDLALANAQMGRDDGPPPTGAPDRIANTYLQMADAEATAAFMNRTVRVDADLEIWLRRDRVFAILPVQHGAAVRYKRALFEITDARREGQQLVVRIRHAAFASWRSATASDVQLALYDSEARTWSALSMVRSIGDQFPGFGLYLSQPLSAYGSPWASSWQSLHELRASPSGAENVDAWQGHVRVVLVESAYVGRVSRAWSDPAVYIAEEAASR